MTSMSDVMDFLVENRAPELKPAVLADIFDRLIWIVRDNGEEISKVRKLWLEGNDPLRAEIALLMSEVFPYSSRSELRSKLAELSIRWPKLQQLCDRLLSDWDNQFNHSR